MARSLFAAYHSFLVFLEQSLQFEHLPSRLLLSLENNSTGFTSPHLLQSFASVIRLAPPI